MRVGRGMKLLQRAMGWMFGCFSTRKERTKTQHTNKVFASASRAFRRGSSRRDKAQVLPDTSVFSQDDKTERDVRKLKARDREELTRTKYVDEPPVNRNCEAEHVKEETVAQLNGSRQVTRMEKGTSSQPAESRSQEHEYMSIDAVFTATSYEREGKENYGEEDLLSSKGDLYTNHQLFASVENLPLSRCSDNSFGHTDEDSRASVSSDKRSFSQQSFDDKPIMGLVAAEWPEPESVKNYKTWDGKGIPNSTSKYKEDQKVSFHTISFEARLERALANQL